MQPYAPAHGPGIAACVALAGVAFSLEQISGVGTLFTALLLGLALRGFWQAEPLQAGASRAARPMTQAGVVLLGSQITLGQIGSLGPGVLIGSILCLGFCMMAGVWIARRMGLGSATAVLSAGAVAICGASAALAISSVLPKSPTREREVASVVAAITVVGLAGMVLYPLVGARLGASETQIALFLGMALHEIAQVVGAGYAVSTDAAATAIAVKFLRVLCLVPVLMMVRSSFKAATEGVAAPLVPTFMLGFVGLSLLASLGLLPEPVFPALALISKGLLAAAMAAIGLQTSLVRVLDDGRMLFGAVLVQSAVVAIAALLVVMLITR